MKRPVRITTLFPVNLDTHEEERLTLGKYLSDKETVMNQMMNGEGGWMSGSGWMWILGVVAVVAIVALVAIILKKYRK
jgi:anti-sigma-K factor RskA